MPTWDLVVEVERTPGGAATPLFVQIARAITERIRRGRLRPGDPLPGTRSLARTLGVHRNTVLAACRELAAEGWITTSPARGTFVSRALPDPAPRPFAPAARRKPQASPPAHAGYALQPPPPPWSATQSARGVAMLVGGKPDVGLVPAMALARAYRRTLKRHGGAVLGYGDPRGHLRLRVAIAAMLGATRGVAATADEVLITRGSQMAMFLVARALLGPGDVVAV